MFIKYNFQKKIFLTYSFFISVILLLIAGSFFIYLYFSKYSEAKNNQIQISTIVNQQIDTSIYQLDRIACGLMFNHEFMSIVSSGEEQVYQYPENNKKIMEMCTSIDAPTLSTYRIMIITPFNYYTLAKTQEENDVIRNRNKNISDIRWYSALREKNKDKLILSNHQDDWSGNQQLVFSVARNITDIKGNVFGFIEVQQDYEKLVKLCEIDSKVGKMTVFDHKGIIQYPVDANPFQNEKVSDKIFNTISSKQELTGFFVEDNIEIAYDKSKYTGWTAITYKYKQLIPPYGKYLLIIVAISFSLLFLVSIFILKYLTLKLTKPLLDLNSSVKEVTLNNLSLSISEFDNDIDEVKQLNKSFDKMFNQLKQSVELLVQSRANEERANFLALQSQMNPHTIYNTISMIESLSYLNGNKDVAEICVQFSQMLRYISDFSEKEYLVKDELQHLNNYVKLMEKRYEGCIRIQVMCEDSALHKILPKFTLQPLVENSIEHGLAKAQFPFEIKVAVQVLPSSWSIEVFDSGSGFPEGKIEEIYESFNQRDKSIFSNSEIIKSKIGGMAIINIYTRFRIMYRENFDFEINNLASGGCIVRLTIREK